MSAQGPKDPFARPEVQWGLGCLLGIATVIGLLILTFLVAIALEPPIWAQVLLGIALVAAGAAVAWLVAKALAEARVEEPRTRSVEEEEEQP